MDFLKLSRSRSGTSSTNKKRSPLPSPSGRRSSGPDADTAQQQASSSSSLLSPPSHALDQQRETASGGAAMSMKSMMSLSPSKGKKTLPLNHDNNSQPQQYQLLQAMEFSFPSLLSPPNPAFVAGSEARGILINAQRPSFSAPSDVDAGGAQTRSSTSTSQVATSKRTSTSGPFSSSYSAGTSSPLAARPPHLRSSVSSDSMLKPGGSGGTSVSPPNNDTDNTGLTASSTDSRGRGRIRFAPLPDPRRPRSHSTGRDIWFDDDSENHIHINTRDGTEASPSSWSNSLNGSSAQSNSLAMSLSDNMEDSLGRSPASHRRTSSTLSKFLQPLKLGRSKSRESNDKQNSPDSEQASNRLSLSTSPSLNHWLNGGEPLARSISTGAGSAEIERQRKEEFKSSGVPLFKSSTQESASQAPPQRRILYPSVAQGGKRRGGRYGGPTGPKVVEPEFVEWTNPSARVGATKEQVEEEDDGSGMAWIKKRRAERERKAKEEAEAQAAAAKTASNSSDAEGATLVDGGSHAKANSEDTIRASNSADASGQPVPNVVAQEESLWDRANDTWTSEDSQSTAEAIATDGQASATTSEKASEDNSEDDEEEEDDDDSSSRGDDDEPEEEEVIDDLTAAEIEEEERLAEEARRTTGGASRELYHSHEHQASTYTFDAPSRNNSAGPSSLNLPPFERNLSYSSFKSDVPRSVATSHPGDWPLREHVVPPC